MAIGGGGGGGAGATGAIQIIVSTSGTNMDPNGYQLIFSESVTHPVAANGSLTLTDVPVGSYQVTLSDIAPNCAVASSSASQSFNVTARATTTLTFAVACT